MTTTTQTRKPGARARLIAAAERLFYAEGIHAVGVDRLCAEAGVSKRSLYQHFGGKDDVVTAMVQARADEFGRQLTGENRSPRGRVLVVFEALDRGSEAPDFHGCPFVGAVTELKDRDHPAARLAREQKNRLTEYFQAALIDGGARDPGLLAPQLTLIFDGASAHAMMHFGSTPATRQAVETLLSAHGM
ncbi:TetR/AcrR family transcriptional regulator [Nocardioides pocheonensis]|uniref:TetR/AcrR family transcriptional regulator n=1 Tax=Nocardioides pocheonensis TaxID=661485 RepID=A0A3N0GIZ1_9ACTN|nr:TetR/AcrR family transcriptional regulator [Nocardioides pocheonensis]RNM12088.1 TetR/AcrR family transcriptional regulator [Nocardioides pocheonensis]